jgi:hypothetical protein
LPVQPLLQKYSCSFLTQITGLFLAIPSQTRAARDRHERGAGCGGRGCAIDEQRSSGRRSRVVLAPRCWRQVARKFLRSDGGKKAGHRGELEGNR